MRPAPTQDRQQVPTVRVLGDQIVAGDRVGSNGGWLVKSIRPVPVPPGAEVCADRAAAELGRCVCSSPFTDPGRMPQHEALPVDQRDREPRRIFDHVRYAVVRPRPARR